MQNLQTNDHYLGNVNVKRDGVKHQFTEDEVKEYVKCGKDPVYFCKKYLKVISLDDGLVPFELYPYQEKMFEHFNNQRFSIILACRQSGKSISSVGYLLWYACFHARKQLQFSQIRVRWQERCYLVLHSCLRICRSFYNWDEGTQQRFD